MFPNPLEWIRLAGVGVLALFLGYSLGQVSGRSQGLKIAEARAAKATIEQLKERGLINEAVNDSDISALCLELGGLPNDCNK